MKLPPPATAFSAPPNKAATAIAMHSLADKTGLDSLGGGRRPVASQDNELRQARARPLWHNRGLGGDMRQWHAKQFWQLLIIFMLLLFAAPAFAHRRLTFQAPSKSTEVNVKVGSLPIFHAQIQVLAHPNSHKTLQTTWTDFEGRAQIQPPENAFVRAVRTFRDADGRLRRLGSKSTEMVRGSKIDVELALEDVHGVWQVLPRSEILQILQLHRVPPGEIQSKIAALFAQLRAERDAAKRAQILTVQRALVAIDDGDVLIGLLEADFDVAQKANVPAELELDAQIAIATGKSLGPPSAEANGLLLEVFAAFFGGRPKDTLPAALSAIALYDQAIATEKRLGHLTSLQRQMAVACSIAALACVFTGDFQRADQIRRRGMEFETALQLNWDIAQSQRFVGDLALRAGDKDNAKTLYASSWNLVRQLRDEEEEISLILQIATLEPAEKQKRLWQLAGKIADSLHDLALTGKVYSQWGRALVQEGKYADALPLLDKAEFALRAASKDLPKLTQAYAQVIGGSGRGQAHYHLQHFPQAIADLGSALNADLADKRLDYAALDAQMLGYCFEETQKFADARKYLLQGAGLYQQNRDEDRSLALDLRRQAAQTWIDQPSPNLAEALQLSELALNDARAWHLRADEAEILEFQGNALALHGHDDAEQPKRAVKLLAQAVAIFAELNDEKPRAQAEDFYLSALRLGADALHTANDPVAAEMYRSAIALAEKLKRPADVASNQAGFALWQFEHGAFADAARLWLAETAFLDGNLADGEYQKTLKLLPTLTAEQKEMLKPFRRAMSSCDLAATALWNAGDLAAATTVLQKRLDLADGHQLHDEAMSTLRELCMYQYFGVNLPAYSATLAELSKRALTDDDRAQVRALGLYSALREENQTKRNEIFEELQQWLQPRLPTAHALPVMQRTGFAQAWLLLGTLEARTGSPKRGLQAMQTAATLLQPQARIGMLSEIGRTYRVLGQLQKAYDAQKQLVAAHETIEMFVPPALRIQTLIELLDLQRLLGQMSEARQTFVAAGKLADVVEHQKQLSAIDRKTLGDLWAIAAQTSMSAAKYSEARQAVASALRYYEGAGRDARTATAFVLKAQLDLLDAVQAAIEKMRSAKAVFDTTEQDKRLLSLRARLASAIDDAIDVDAYDVVLTSISALGLPQKNLESQALKHKLLEKAEQRARASGSLAHLPYLTFLIADVFRGDKDWPQVEQYLLKSIVDLKTLRSSLQSDETKVSLLNVNDEAIYGGLVEVLLQEGKIEQALEISEQGRGRAFLDVLATSDVRQTALQSKDQGKLSILIEQLQGLAATDNALDVEIVAPALAAQQIDPSSGRVRAAIKPQGQVKLKQGDKAQQLRELLAQIEKQRKSMAQSTSELSSLVTAPIVQIDEMKQIAKSRQTTLIEYYLHEGLTIFVVAPDGQIHEKTYRMDHDLGRLIAELRQSLGVQSGRGAVAIAEDDDKEQILTLGKERESSLDTLTRLLIDPVRPWLPTDEGASVTIVPHKQLFLLPFAVLPWAKDQPLIAKFTLNFVPAIGVLRYTGQRQRSTGMNAVIVGNPLMPQWNHQVLPPLPGAEAEGAEIAATLAAVVGKPWKVEKFGAARATEKNVTQAMQQADLIHLATHGIARDDQPMQSFIALAPDKKDDLTSGWLTVDDVFHLNLHANLVVLSACQTGLGRISGDGVMGLSRAFLYAGTPSVLVSLWSVSDEATKFQMHAFYQALVGGQTTAAALRTAQLATREKWPQPAMWAAFQLTGEAN